MKLTTNPPIRHKKGLTRALEEQAFVIVISNGKIRNIKIKVACGKTSTETINVNGKRRTPCHFDRCWVGRKNFYGGNAFGDMIYQCL
jgi:hypothetical protein